MEFVVGQEYSRLRDIHEPFGGSRQSGISPSKEHPAIFLFSSSTGEQYGYKDGPQENGTYLYTGEGQKGDMTFKRGNKALLNASTNGLRIFLFEQSRRGYVRFVSTAGLLGHHIKRGPDRDGTIRKVIVFELELLPSEEYVPFQQVNAKKLERPYLSNKSLEELRELALTRHVDGFRHQHAAARKVYERSIAVKEYVLKRANGICEGCNQPAPFKRPNGEWYLETHHIARVADGGPDHPDWVVALCPNCHRRVHSGVDGMEYNATLSRGTGHIAD